MKVVFEQGKSASKLLKYIFFFNIIASEEVEGKCHPVNKLNDDISKLYLLRENPRYLVVHLLEQGRDTRAGHHARPSTNRLTHVPTHPQTMKESYSFCIKARQKKDGTFLL